MNELNNQIVKELDDMRPWNDQYMLRLPDGMRDRIKKDAIRSGRSMNDEIVYRIVQALGLPGSDSIFEHEIV